MIRKSIAFLATLSLACAPVLAQSSAQPVTPGFLSTTGCSAGLTVCFLPYSNTNPLPVSGGGGGGGGAVTAVSGAYALGSIVDIGTGASPGANTVNGRLATINTTLGTPFQAGGSIGNTSFASTQSGTWTVGLGAGAATIGAISNTAFGATQSGTWNITNVSGTVSLPTNAAQETGGNLATLTTQQTSATTAIGSQSDAVCGTATGTCSLIALSKYSNNLTSFNINNGTANVSGGNSSSDGLSTGLQTLYTTALGRVFNGTSWDRSRGDVNGSWVVMSASASASVGIAPATTQGSNTNSLKGTAGNVYSLQGLASTTAGFLILYDAATAPTSGTALTATLVRYCMPIAASQGLDKVFQVPAAMTNGAQILFSTTCSTYTAVSPAAIQLTGQVK